ncbi:hypothetical protein GCG54_00008537 [Colletotrichum gloeosporioides]|uniref:CENP-V/GFA domain-containing protein n=1 Tax=Colletotrichum gloeosporioides TaxID=474922 RepID=A0A8H4C569_COLGL|nr:uncharacterized protein GCG54_00008537 [Colletotrichum gloeosporioides]KAF3797545.1 hypothetical protein GCG54_00008537 [Colletotrichum gloeosporioides]
MTSGTCLCGAAKVTIKGDPLAAAMCHCLDCRKTSGSAFAVNWVVPASQLSVTDGASLKEFTAPALSGNPVTNHFCGSCGTTLWREGPKTQGLCYVKAGILDDADAVNMRKPSAEIFTTRRIEWMKPMEGALQKKELME